MILMAMKFGFKENFIVTPEEVTPGTCPVCDELLREYQPYPSETSLRWLTDALKEHWRTGHKDKRCT
jgi:transcription initiation factor IIE alpha subunit